MRQAGRYLPEYKNIRAKAASFLDFCYSPTLATEATLQPIRRFHFDAAILFSDILVVPDAFGQKVSFESGNGPKLKPISDAKDLAKLRETIDLAHLSPVFETVERVKAALPPEVTLIGFCGAPWTVASYMIAGQGTPDQAPARLFAYREPELFQSLIDRLIAGSIDYLAKQIEAGAEIVQIFDSWAGVLPADEFARWCLRPIQAIITGLRVRCPNVKVIAFPRGAGAHLQNFATATGADVLGLDTAVDLAWAAEAVTPATALQGNLDPLALLAGGESLRQGIARITGTLSKRPYIFNLGHGILPETPLAHVEALLAQLRA
jgi:uroporphyrinogen decarboxylase